MITKLLQNWKTTSAGLTMILGSIVHLIFAIRSHTADENTWTVSLGVVVGGVGLLLAGDADKSASTADAKALQTQIREVPSAINSGNTERLERAIPAAPIPDGQPLIKNKDPKEP